MDFVGKRYVWFTISGVAILISLGFIIFSGFNFGVDFTGGTLLQLTFEEDVTVQQVKDALSGDELEEFDLGTSFVQKSEDKVLIRSRELSDADKAKVLEVLRRELGGGEDLESQTIGPVVGRELYMNAIKALVIASVLMIIYISLRFQPKSAVIAVIALLSDVILVLGVFSIFKIEVSSSFVAAILTVIGYSINNTIVVFDRVRENAKFSKGESLSELVNKSISQTLTRSINTSLTTLFPVAALFFFGAPVIKEFSLAVLIGLIVGTYSSIFTASPLWAELKFRTEGANAKY